MSAVFAAASVLPFTFGTRQTGAADWSVNVAVTDRAWLIVTLQVPVPEQFPDQPEKTDPLAGVAVSVTLVPVEYAWEHVAPQLMPAGFELTVPDPPPEVATVKVWVGA